MKVFLKPKDGYVVINSDTMRILPADGEAHELSDFWVARLRDGDVYIVEPKVETVTTTKPVAVVVTEVKPTGPIV